MYIVYYNYICVLLQLLLMMWIASFPVLAKKL